MEDFEEMKKALKLVQGFLATNPKQGEAAYFLDVHDAKALVEGAIVLNLLDEEWLELI